MLICWMYCVPWDDAIVVSAGKLRKLWDSLSELRRSFCERRLERSVLRLALLPVKTAQFTQFFRQVWSHTVKSPLRTRITEISRFRCGANEIFILLGCYVVRVCSSFPTFRNNLSVSSPRLKQYKNTCWNDRFLEMGPIGCTETSATTNLRRLTFPTSEDLIYITA